MKRLVFSTFDYTVSDGDTVEKIAARFDCTPSQLIKFNKLKSRVLFHGQKICVPDGSTVEEEVSNSRSKSFSGTGLRSPKTIDKFDHRKTPIIFEDVAVAPAVAAPAPSTEEDVECVLKFFKVRTEHYLLDGSRATGVFIVTPTCAMFDPDVEPDEQLEQVQEKFGVIASLDDVLSISLYETKVDKATRNKLRAGSIAMNRRSSESPRRCSMVVGGHDPLPERKLTSTSISLDMNLNSREHNDKPLSKLLPFYSLDNPAGNVGIIIESANPSSDNFDERQRTVIREPTITLSPQVIRRKLSSGLQKLRKNWRSGDSTDSDKSPNFDASPFIYSTGLSSDGSDSRQNPSIDQPRPNDPSFETLRVHFLALESFIKKTLDLRYNLPHFYEALKRVEKLQSLEPFVSKQGKYAYFLCIRILNQSNGLNENLEISTKKENGAEEAPENRPLKKCKQIWFGIPTEKIDILYLLFLQWSVAETHLHSEDLDRGDLLLNHEEQLKAMKFLVVDEPKYAETPNLSDVPALNPATLLPAMDRLSAGQDTGSQQQNLKLVWQLTKIDEFKRRFALQGLTDSYFLPVPEGSAESKILNEAMIRHLMGVLPARAQSYPWVCVYSTRAHGFSLRTMYSKIAHFNEETSPTLVVVQDSQHHVFGAIVSCQLHVSEYFYGSGQSLLFTSHPNFSVYRWTGRNSFVVKGSVDSLAIGSGRGTFGLYLDADLFHGRTQRCDTFSNEPLTDPADFTVVGVEVFGFRL